MRREARIPSAQPKEPVVGAAAFAAVVTMVVFTTMVTPPLLKLSLARTPLAPDAQADAAVQTYATREWDVRASSASTFDSLSI